MTELHTGYFQAKLTETQIQFNRNELKTEENISYKMATRLKIIQFYSFLFSFSN